MNRPRRKEKWHDDPGVAHPAPVLKDTHPGEFDLVILGGDVDTNEIDEMNK